MVSSDYEGRVRRMYALHAPERLPDVPGLMARYDGNEERLITALVGKYGPEPAADSHVPGDTGSCDSADAGTGSVHYRVRRMYQHYAPERLGNIPAVLRKYHDNEDRLLAALVAKYGPEPPSPLPQEVGPSAGASPAPDTASPAVRDDEARLRAFFEVYDPAQVPDVSTWLANWRGREADLFARLVAHHGEEPSSDDAATDGAVRAQGRGLLHQVLHFYAPARTREVDTILQDWEAAGHLRRLVAMLQQQVRHRDAALDLWQGDPDAPGLVRRWLHREGELLGLLEAGSTAAARAHAPDNTPPLRLTPPPQAMDSVAVAVVRQPTESVRDHSAGHRERLVAFYQEHNKSKLGEVDATLAAYKGREETLFRSLKRKYTRGTGRTTSGAETSDAAVLEHQPHSPLAHTHTADSTVSVPPLDAPVASPPALHVTQRPGPHRAPVPFLGAVPPLVTKTDQRQALELRRLLELIGVPGDAVAGVIAAMAREEVTAPMLPALSDADWAGLGVRPAERRLAVRAAARHLMPRAASVH